jgi:hypothetical protein
MGEFMEEFRVESQKLKVRRREKLYHRGRNEVHRGHREEGQTQRTK